MISKASEPETGQRESPKGRFGFSRRSVFTCEESGAPFDMDRVILPPGKRNFPHHSHAALWEMYYVVSGTATFRIDQESHEVTEGDSVMCPPGMAHQIINESNSDVVYLIISNDPPFDSCFYPDSGKLLVSRKVWNGQPEDDRVFWTKTDETYYVGEE
jgi:uncharacterized cupin superfamily protein